MVSWPCLKNVSADEITYLLECDKKDIDYLRLTDNEIIQIALKREIHDFDESVNDDKWVSHAEVKNMLSKYINGFELLEEDNATQVLLVYNTLKKRLNIFLYNVTNRNVSFFLTDLYNLSAFRHTVSPVSDG